MRRKLVWAIRRLSLMTPAEVALRLRDMALRTYDRSQRLQWADFTTAGPAPDFPGLRDSLHALDDRGRDAIAAAAAQLLAGEFHALGLEWPKRPPEALFPEALWRLDPVTGGLWPGADRFAPDVGYRHQSDLGSVKYVWEFNRLQWLQPLAAHYALTGSPEALSAIEAAVESWFSANPPFRGVNWNSGIELALRAHSLIVCAALCGDAISEGGRTRIRAILGASLYWLKRYPSHFSSANNHLVLELFAKFLIQSLVEGLNDQAAAVQAQASLEREALAQILPDGVGAEQSLAYASFTVEALLTVALVTRRLGRSMSPAFDARLAAFAEWVAWFALPDGSTPSIGDDDESTIWHLNAGLEGGYPSSIAAAVAGYLRRPAFGPTPRSNPLRLAVFSAPQAPGPPRLGVRTFPQGGYTVIRRQVGGRDVHLVQDHGPLGYLSIAAHGHADANAVFLALDGRPVLIDPGTYIYHAEDDWRTWFRGTAAHNTVCIAGLDQSQVAGPFMWTQKAHAWLEAAEEDEAACRIVGVHDGYRRRFGVLHRRTLSLREDGLVIGDEVSPAPPDAPMEVAFQFAPWVEVRPSADGRWLAVCDDVVLSLAFDPPGQVSISLGADRKDGGWVSPEFGRRVPAPRLSWRADHAPAGVTTTIRWAPETLG